MKTISWSICTFCSKIGTASFEINPYKHEMSQSRTGISLEALECRVNAAVEYYTRAVPNV